MHTLTDDERHYEKYIIAGIDLLTTPDGPAPSARALVARLGGSLTTANKAMKIFWKFVARQMAYQKQYPEGTPSELIQLLETMMAKARTQAQDELQQEQDRVAQEEKEMQNRVRFLTEKMTELDRQVDQYHGKLHDAEQIQADLSQSLEKQTTLLEQERQERQILEQQHSKTQSECEQLQSHTNVLQHTLTETKAKLQASEDKCESVQEQYHSTLRDHDALKIELKFSTTQHTEETEKRKQCEQQIQQQQAQLSDQSHHVERLKHDHQHLQNSLDKAQSHNAKLIIELDTQQTDKTNLQQQLHSLKQQLCSQEHLQQQIKTLEVDKQELMEILASLNNRLQVK